MRVIAAVVIGGGSLSGGEGTVLGTLIGCLIMAVLANGCVHAGIPNAIQDIVIGIIIIVAVTLDRLRRGSGDVPALSAPAGPQGSIDTLGRPHYHARRRRHRSFHTRNRAEGESD